MALSNKNTLAAMLERATNPDAENIDELAVQIFCVIIRKDTTLIHDATDLIVSKIQSLNVTQAIRALSVLEECMTKCGSNFQDEISKFRFLNGLIRLVSKKYQGEKTPAPIRQKIMDCLLLWTTEYPEKDKIREAYNLLRKEGNDHTPVVNQSKKDNIMGIDEAKFRKLLHSGNAEDLRRANLLIQSRVNQDARRVELMCRHKTELQEMQNTAALLNQMLDSNEKSLTEEGGEEDSINLMKELYESCESYLPIIERLPELIDNTNEELIEETLDVNGRLQSVLQRYKNIMSKRKSPSLLQNQPKPSINTSNLLSGLLLQPEPIEPTTSKPTENPDPLNELSEIFGSCNNTTSNIQRSIFDSTDLLEPITMTTEKKSEQIENNEKASPKYDHRKLKEIDIISEELLKANLKSLDKMPAFKKEPEKVTLNELVREKSIQNSNKQHLNNTSPEKPDTLLLDAYLPSNNIANEADKQGDNDSLNLKDEPILGEPLTEKTDEVKDEEKPLPVVHLADIHIDLDDVSATSEMLLLDDDIKVTLNFTSNKPSPNVSVIVVSVTNQSKLPVTCFQFDASVRKPCKIRLLPATGDSMPGVKPFRPSAPICLIMLLLNPTKSNADVTCIVGYKLGDDPDPIKESIVAKGIAYVE